MTPNEVQLLAQYRSSATLNQEQIADYFNLLKKEEEKPVVVKEEKKKKKV
jgi:hypothetical protein